MSKIPFVKSLIELATTVEEADKTLTEHLGFKTYAEKLAFVSGTFGLDVGGRCNSDETTEETRISYI